MRVVCLSDTHSLHGQVRVPDGDVLIHAGDLSGNGQVPQIAKFIDWFAAQPHKHKVFIAGNHDFLFEDSPGMVRGLFDKRGLTYLQDSGATIDGLLFWGSPWQPRFLDWAFNLDRGPAISRKWDIIPQGTTVLITHGPPLGTLDRVHEGPHVGCGDLGRALDRVRPAVHVFGHIHEGYGAEQRGPTLCVNASICTRNYKPTNPPIVVDLTWETGPAPVAEVMSGLVPQDSLTRSKA